MIANLSFLFAIDGLYIINFTIDGVAVKYDMALTALEISTCLGKSHMLWCRYETIFICKTTS